VAAIKAIGGSTGSCRSGTRVGCEHIFDWLLRRLYMLTYCLAACTFMTLRLFFGVYHGLLESLGWMGWIRVDKISTRHGTLEAWFILASVM
jgi:hypothetical protein